MKMLVYRVRRPKGNGKREFKMNFEKILFLSFIVMFTLLIITQTVLMNPKIKNYVSVDSQYQGTVLGSEEFLYKKGEITLQLQNTDSDDKLKVLVNGEVVGAFINKTLTLNVKDGDVIEIDASEINSIDVVKVVSKSDNVVSDVLDKEIKIMSGVKKLTTISIK